MRKNRLLNRRRVLLLGLGSLACMGAVGGQAEFQRQQILALNNPKRDFSSPQGGSLRKRAAAKGIIYGAAVRHDHLLQDAQYANCIAKECGMLVPEWALKWSAPNKPLRPSPDSFDFSAADGMVKFANTHGMLFRGHTLVWHEAMPKWLREQGNNQNAARFLEQHIKTVVGRYAGKIHSWDVVNEAIQPADGRTDGLRLSPWLNWLGPDYISQAFRLAAAADPKAMLVYNDYGLDYNTSKDEAKRTAVLKLLERLKSQGTPIHALGIQAHLWGTENRFSPQKLREFLRNVASLGLKIMITEMDVADKELPQDVTVRDRIVASAYEDYLTAVLEERAVIAVLTWGLSDRYSWLSEFQPRKDGTSVRPLPFDAQMNRKLGWNAITRAFDKAPLR